MTAGESYNKFWKKVGVWVLPVIFVAGGLLAGQAVPLLSFASSAVDRSSSEILRHLKRRLEGHTKLEAVLLPPLQWMQAKVERPVPSGQLPTLGKGVQHLPFANVRYASDGKPLPVFNQAESGAVHSDLAQLKIVASSEEIIQSIEKAKAGDIIHISPGVYRLTRKARPKFAGSPGMPIIVRAALPGQVTIEFTTTEGFLVTHAFWVFENLRIKGVCKNQDDCEHAFHVVAKAQNTVIRNNLIEEYNAHIKVNGYTSDWPDNGLIQNNTLVNSIERNTLRSVTPIDIVGASGWVVADNVVANFVKSGGNKVSFGIFMKGASEDGRIERNLVVCSHRNISLPGVRVGISLGGGGSAPVSVCRDQRCGVEHRRGTIVNNVVAHCSDDGIDVHKSSDSLVAYNTLINTAGIAVRVAPASANIQANMLDGSIRQRTGGIARPTDNTIGHLTDWLDQPDALRLLWTTTPDGQAKLPTIKEDFCRRARQPFTYPGAIVNITDCRNRER